MKLSDKLAKMQQDYIDRCTKSSTEDRKKLAAAIQLEMRKQLATSINAQRLEYERDE